MEWVAVGTTDRGLRRRINEDAFRVRQDVGLFLVADGMGGHAAGEVASAMAADIVERETAAALANGGAARIRDTLKLAVRHAHRAILARATQEAEKDGMGTTLTALVLRPDDAAFHIAHVGDSRAYRLRGGELVQLTTDHTWVQRQIDTGYITAVEARTHPFASILTRAVGGPDNELEVDILHGDVTDGDLLLLCTDGLSSMVEDADIRAMLDRPLPLEAIAAQLVEAANQRGGLDNITAILIRVTA